MSQMPPTLSLSRVPILVVFTLYAIAFGLSVPAYPILLNQYTFDDMGKAVLLIGLSNFIKHFLEFFSTPVLGSMSDSLGRKPILLFSLVIVSIESYSVAVYPSIACMMMARVFAGLGDCCFLIAYTIITDISVLNGDNLTQGYGWLSGCFSLGFVVGPLLGSYIQQQYGNPAVFLLAGVCTTIAFAFALFFVVESNLQLREFATWKEKALRPWQIVGDFFRHKSLRALSVPYSVCFFTAGIYSVFVLHMKGAFKASNLAVGYYLSSFGLLSAFHDVFVIHSCIPSLVSDEFATIALMALETIRFVSFAFATNMESFYVVMVAFSITTIYQVSLKTIVYKASKDSPQGNIQGALGSIRTLSLGVGSLFYSALYSYSLKSGPQYVCIPFLTAAAIVCFGCVHTARQFFKGDNSRDYSEHGSGNENDDVLAILLPPPPALTSS